MVIHYVWIGGKPIPPKYINNYKICVSLNPTSQFKLWGDYECNTLLHEYNLLEYANSISFISKCNLLKYLILGKLGGIYTDFDIKWKISFNKILLQHGFPQSDLLLTIVGNSPFFINNQRIFLLDDPFIASKPNMLNQCVGYCLKRTKFKIDGDLYLNKGIKDLIPIEPVGPFGLTEWVYKNNINVSVFPQDSLLDNDGFYGNHEQKSSWKSA